MHFRHDGEIFPPKTAKKRPRRRMSQSALGGVETGVGTRHGVWWPPLPGWCLKLGAKWAFPYFRLCSIASGTGTNRVHRGSGPGPSERPRGDGDPGGPPPALWTRPHGAPSHAKAQRPPKNGRISPPPTIPIPSWLRECSGRSSVSLGIDLNLSLVGGTPCNDARTAARSILACAGPGRMHAIVAPAP